MSTLKVNSIEPANAGSEDYFLARAWVNFNGTGTVAIRQDGNVSSITDNGTGDYNVNFTSSFIDANYAASGSGGGTSRSYVMNKEPTVPPTASSIRVRCVIPNVGIYDDANMNVVVTR